MSKRRTRENRYATSSLQKKEQMMKTHKWKDVRDSKNNPEALEQIDKRIAEIKESFDRSMLTCEVGVDEEIYHIDKDELEEAFQRYLQRYPDIKDFLGEKMTCDTKKTQFDKFLSKIITVIESAGHNVIHISEIQNAKKITTDRCSKVLVYFSGKIVVQGSLEHRDSLKEALQSQNFNVS